MRRTSKPCHYYQCGLSRRPHRVGTSVIKAERESDGEREEERGRLKILADQPKGSTIWFIIIFFDAASMEGNRDA